jgi:hypothetical protein
MERLKYGTEWLVSRHNENELYKVKHLENGKWRTMIHHDNLEFIKSWLCYSYGVLRPEELSPEYRQYHLEVV